MQVQELSQSVVAPSQVVSGGGRLVSLDVFRGLTVAAMILVTDPGVYGVAYAQLNHAQWDGATATDMIFPSFLVAVGIALTLSFAARLARGASRGKLMLHVLRRSALLVLLGLAVNWYPKFNLHTLRIPGILQRIGVCYLLASLLYLGSDWVSRRTGRERFRSGALMAVVITILAGYWALLKLYPVPGFGAGRMDSLGNAAAVLDRAAFGVRHMWEWGLTPGYGVTYDSEGILSTFPALATTLMGVLAGSWLATPGQRAKKVLGLVGSGAVLVILGLAMNPLLAINKRIWTSSFALLSGGVALLVFSACYAALDLPPVERRWRWGLTPALVFGTNAILAFVLSQVITGELIRQKVGGTGLHQWMYAHWFATWLRPAHASLGYALMIVAFNGLLLWPLYRRRIFLRL